LALHYAEENEIVKIKLKKGTANVVKDGTKKYQLELPRLPAFTYNWIINHTIKTAPCYFKDLVELK
jgi:hypothetical protein